MLTPYKTFFGKVISKEDVEAYVAEPMKMVAWVAKNIQVNKECNLGAPPVSPQVCGKYVWLMPTVVISSSCPWHAAWEFPHALMR